MLHAHVHLHLLQIMVILCPPDLNSTYTLVSVMQMNLQMLPLARSITIHLSVWFCLISLPPLKHVRDTKLPLVKQLQESASAA